MLADHQRIAANRACDLLDTRGGLILADDVGLGKSYVAAEVARRCEHVEFVVPLALVEQWRETLRMFGVDARISTHDRVTGDGGQGTGTVIVDEAHAFRNPQTRRYDALAKRCAGARVMLVTATPVCNSIGDLKALIDLFARDDLLANVGIPSIDVAFETREGIESIVAELVIRRDKTVLPETLRFGELQRRVIRHRVPNARGIDALRFPLVGDHAILRRFLWRRLESSEAALVESIRRQLRFYQRALSCIAAGRTLPKRDYRRAFGHEEDRDAFQEVLFWELFAPAGAADASEVRDEMRRLEAIVDELEPSQKRSMLVELVNGSSEPMLIFTGSAATALDLYDALRDVARCGVVTSRERSREAVLRSFIDGRIDVVISTDMAAEGLNLQRAGTVVHYDIPWNPVKLDQRNGRAHRIGQTRPSVRAIYFLPDSRETRVVETIAAKNRMRRRVLRASATNVIAQCTLRPRVAKGAAVLQLRGDVPELLERRHRAGIERLMSELPIAELVELCERPERLQARHELGA